MPRLRTPHCSSAAGLSIPPFGLITLVAATVVDDAGMMVPACSGNTVVTGPEGTADREDAAALGELLSMTMRALGTWVGAAG